MDLPSEVDAVWSIYYILVEYATQYIMYNARLFLIISIIFDKTPLWILGQKSVLDLFLHCFWLFSIPIIAHYQDAL